MIKKWFIQNKNIFLIGFASGAVIAPFLATLGVISQFFEMLRPVLIGPFDLVASLIPDVQIAQYTFYAPWYKWVICLGFNGICYALFFVLIQKIYFLAKR